MSDVSSTESITNSYLQQKRGKLRLYLGYAPAVGKTTAMLKDALAAKQEGADVVVGSCTLYDNKTLLTWQKQLPFLHPLERELSAEITNASELDFDVNAAILRQPELIVIDELAHQNTAEGLHAKRIQDVEALLNNGIDVYTTVNIASIQSLAHTAALILESEISETIPDSFFEKADQIELIDVDPENLLDRYDQLLKEKGRKNRQLIEQYRSKNKLIALREIALRKTADQIFQLSNESFEKEIEREKKEHILVCVSAARSSAHVIRAAAKMARAFNGTFTALYVGRENKQTLSTTALENLNKNLLLAEQLGAQLSTLYGHDLAEEIAEYARISRVTKIVLGKSASRSHWWQPSFVDTLTQLVQESDIYIIPDNQLLVEEKKTQLRQNKPKFSKEDALKTVSIIALCTLVGLTFERWQISDANIMMVYILGVLLNALITKEKSYSVGTSVISVLVFNYFFVTPRFSFAAWKAGYPMTFLVMLVVGLFTSILTERIKKQKTEIAEKAYRTEILLETNQKLQKSDSPRKVLEAAAKQLEKLLDRQITAYEIDVESKQKKAVMVFGKEDSMGIASTNTTDTLAVQWVLEHNRPAGKSTEAYTTADYLYLPIGSKETIFAVVGISMIEKTTLEIFEQSISQAILGECVLALEREWLRKKQQDISLKVEEEQLRSDLLRSISHDLRTPLTSILGHAKVLMDNPNLSVKQKREMYGDVYDDAIWLINLVENLLAITRIDKNNSMLKLVPDSIEEIVLEAVKHVDRQITAHHFTLDMSDEVMIARVEPRLLMQVIINLVNNAVKHTAQGSAIELRVQRGERRIKIEICDDGPGIPNEEKEKVFEMFYKGTTGSYDSRRGMGLGLTLCKSIIEAHGGKLYLKDNHPNGLIVGFELPLVEVALQ